MLINIILVGVGSMFGGISRYLLSEYIRQTFPGTFPVGTILVNTLGCFLIGLLSGLLATPFSLSPAHRLLFAVGFCGSFTTFSTFAMENLLLLNSKEFAFCALNIVLSLLFGLLATWWGFQLTKQ